MNKNHFLRHLKDTDNVNRGFKMPMNLTIDKALRDKLVELAFINQCSLSTLCASIFKQYIMDKDGNE